MPKIRNFPQRRQILSRLLGGEAGAAVQEEFGLRDDELQFYNSKANKALIQTALDCGDFSAEPKLPTAKPFLYVAIPSCLTALFALVFGLTVYWIAGTSGAMMPIYAACLTVGVLALGWTFVGFNQHNNTVRQNTNTMLFARYAHQPFSDALHRFHSRFGYDATQGVTLAELNRLRRSDQEADRKVAAALVYLLNYYEFIASGVIRGDLDEKVVRQNIRAQIVFYHDKCWPLIEESRRGNSLVYEHLSNLRLYYRDAN